MYKLLLTFRYLRRKLIPIFAMLAVVLCTAMVIIVISVMGGFLELVRNAGRTVMGDVSIAAGLGGFPRYEAMIEEIEALPEADAATPVIKAYGLLKLPGEQIEGVQVHGIKGEGQAAVTQYRDILYWTPETLADHARVRGLYESHDPVRAAVEMRPPWPEAEGEHAMVPGIEVSPYNQRLSDGSYSFRPSIIGTKLTLTILPISERGAADTLSPSTEQFRVINEFNSGVFDVDSQRVLIPFDVARKMMRMEAAEQIATNPDGSPKLNPDGTVQVTGEVPARATEIHVRAADGVTPEALREKIIPVYGRFAREYDGVPMRNPMTVATWEQRQATFLSAVENEKRLMTVLFGIISLTAVVMIGVIFYMIVLEKTHDIGILRALGASKAGVAAIFLSFGAVIGVLGSLIGTGLAYLMVHNINAIHAWLGEGLGFSAFAVGVPLGTLAFCIAIAAGFVVIRSIFELRRGTALLSMAGIGAAIGLAALAFRLYFVLWGRADAPGSGGWGLWVAVIMGLAVAFAVVSVLYTAIDVAARKRDRAKVLTLGGAAGLIAALFVAVTVAVTDGLATRLNRALSVQIWDRSVYFFDQIPNQIDWFEVSVVILVAIVASIVGALIPAVMAGLQDPIDSLRYE